MRFRNSEIVAFGDIFYGVKAYVDEERVESAYRAFRKALGVKRAGKR